MRGRSSSSIDPGTTIAPAADVDRRSTTEAKTMRTITWIGRQVNRHTVRRIVMPVVWAVWMTLSGCASGGLHGQGVRHLEDGDYAQAATLLEQEIAQHPDHWRAQRDLGIAYYEMDKYEDARERLRAALAAGPDDGRALYYLGKTEEALGDTEAALNIHRKYTLVSRLSRYRGAMEEEVKRLVRQMAREEIKERLAQEETLPTAAGSGRSIAVAPLEPAGPEEICRPLGAAMAEWIMTDLSKIEELTVVERLRLNALLQELRMGGSGEISAASAPRMGRLLGVSRFVNGSLLQLERKELRVDLAVTDVRTSDTESQLAQAGNLEDFFQLEKEIVFQLLEELQIEPTPYERAEIQRVPTRNLNAALAYGRGLIAERRGDLIEARTFYREALEHDSDFAMAGEALDQLPGEPVDLDDPLVEDIAEDVEDRLEETDDLTGGDMWPEDPNDVDPVPDPERLPDPPGPPGTPEIPDPPDAPETR
ncbi:MAG: tetratricopeptide repeat protein [Candidatus Eisenbacteria bacterium]|nr:tetratricopeptide repeat protein [Candidatus Eisenbacteria bacterium]